ncbi:MAG: DUF1552 domain-containing protein [Verrucomicrobia bacterium]|nr:DUF1552 domain-containing protein [Verrucomicrobiota bacterium]
MEKTNRAPYLAKPALGRRTFLRSTGLAMSLPFLDAMNPLFGKGIAAEEASPRRMVAIETNQGILPRYFFPEKKGEKYEATDYLKILKAHRDQMTIFSGVSHPGVDGGHAAQKCFLTGTPHPARGGFRNGISLDQLAAEEIGSATRFPSLSLAVTNENATLSYTRSGAAVPSDQSPRKLYENLFLQGKPSEIEAKVEALRQGRSTMDFLSERAKKLNRSLSSEDRDRMDQYFTSVRELEKRMHASEQWEYEPKPKVDTKIPDENKDRLAFVSRSRTMFDMIRLALETDSTRVVSLFIDTTVIHNITHHGNRPETLAELKNHETGQFEALNGFLSALSESGEKEDNLLDRTMVLYGTCMGSANSHSNYNLPVLLAGGGFKHGQHLVFDDKNNYPLTNLYLSMLHRMGIRKDKFSTSTGLMRGLDLA